MFTDLGIDTNILGAITISADSSAISIAEGHFNVTASWLQPNNIVGPIGEKLTATRLY